MPTMSTIFLENINMIIAELLYATALNAYSGNYHLSQNIEIVEVDYDHATGIMAKEAFAAHADDVFAGVVIQHPNFFGNMEQVDAITDWAHEHNALLIAVTNPLSLTMMKPVSEWGEKGADIVVGEGQPSVVPVASIPTICPPLAKWQPRTGVQGAPPLRARNRTT